MLRITCTAFRAAAKKNVAATKAKAAPAKTMKSAAAAGIQTQQSKMAEFLNKTFEETPIDDVGERAFGESAVNAQQQEVMPVLPESADPMVALVAASVDMQQRQTDQMEQAAVMQQEQHRRTISAMQKALDEAKGIQAKHLDNLRNELTDRRVDEVETLRLFGEQQRKYLRNTLEAHTDAEKKRLDNFRRTSEAAATRKLKLQEDKFTKSVSQVSSTLSQHAAGIQRLLNGLQAQQEVTKGLTESIEKKAAAALSSKKASTNAAVTAIHAIEASLRKEQEKGAAAVVSAVASRNKKQVENVKCALNAHTSAQKKQLVASFKSHQDAQIKGLAAAVAHQKQTQSQQLSDLREALAARRRIAFRGDAQAPQIGSPLLRLGSNDKQ